MPTIVAASLSTGSVSASIVSRPPAIEPARELIEARLEDIDSVPTSIKAAAATIVSQPPAIESRTDSFDSRRE